MGTRENEFNKGGVPEVSSSFQNLLLQFSSAAGFSGDPQQLVQSFCEAARRYFRVDGVYYYQALEGNGLIGAAADGIGADTFPGLLLHPEDSAVAAEAARSKKTIVLGNVDALGFKFAARFQAKALMAAPFVVANEVVGVSVYVHASDPAYFREDLATQATILAGQMGSMLEALRLQKASLESQRRAEILAEVAQQLWKTPEISPALNMLAERIRNLLRSPLVCIFLRRQSSFFELRAVSASTPDLSAAAVSRHDRRALLFAADLANRAIETGELLTVTIDPSTHPLTDLVHTGMLMAAPFRSSTSHGAVLIYPREDAAYTNEERALMSTITGFGALVVANSELYATARQQAQELQQLLSISAELGSLSNLDKFLERFAHHAAEFLGFQRAFIALLEDGKFHVRWGVEHGRSTAVNEIFPDGPANQALLKGRLFWSNDAASLKGVDREAIAKFKIEQVLTVPLHGAQGQLIGMFGVLDRADRGQIASEDAHRASALGTQAAMALEVTRNLHASEQHRLRAEALMQFATSLGASLQLQDFAATLCSRAKQLSGASAVGFVAFEDGECTTLVLENSKGQPADNEELSNFTTQVCAEFEQSHGMPHILNTGSAVESKLGDELGWSDVTAVPMRAASGALTGILYLARNSATGTISSVHGISALGWANQNASDHGRLLEVIAAQGSIALENVRLFARIDTAGRHWMGIFDSIEDFIVAHDRANLVTRVNGSLAEFIGADPQDLIGASISSLLETGPETSIHICPFCLLNDRGEDEYIHPTLNRIYLVSTSRVQENPSGDPQTVHVLKDITDRREAERRYGELFDNIQEGLFFCTQDGRFVEVNDALVRMLGFESREELLKADAVTQIYQSPERFAKLVSLMQQEGQLQNYEETLRRRDGSQIHVLINAFAVRDAQGRVLQYRGLILDVSGLRMFESELLRERDFSGKILSHTQSLVLVADVKGQIGYANRRWYDLGFDQKQLLGQSLRSLVTPAALQSLQEAFDATVTGRQMDNVDLQIARGDNRPSQFSANFSPMRDERDQVTSIVVVMSDVTDAANLQAKLMHAEKMAAVGQLVSGVAHEVNNPLTAILGFADLLMENPEMPESARKDLRVILQEAQRTKQIVQNLLSFARQMPPQKQPVQLNPILHRTVQLRSYDLHSRSVEVIESLAQDLPAVIGDAHQLQQVFLNILNNAYDAVREIKRTARIEIASQVHDGTVEVRFIDNGEGISSPERIFDPFFTTKGVGQGTGLGLSICYGIVREHGGEISCENNPEGGATFLVRLPAAQAAASVRAAVGGDQKG